eukprot:CAMPEP_0183348674 /NCGR_PEP_ID=MMETSP0164_2-20130417/13112_1 /TAXON_ID=221442 /ORGANISM="Coccolithus pelagicus ssp braarudi, Strain PLY182g" /LENGTH=51 /DNA_ID=CAMNT_0025520301 /DNA_START=212 /DNA_END=367 /DNA_ORIENTATION=+
MAQLTTLQTVQRALVLELEECRVDLARRQERAAVEARLAIEIQKQRMLTGV